MLLRKFKSLNFSDEYILTLCFRCLLFLKQGDDDDETHDEL